MKQKIITTKNAPNCLGPYVQAIKTGNIVFVSGQIGICPKTGKIPIDIQEETYQVLTNIKLIIQASGLNISNIVKTTVFITNICNINLINIAYKNFFETNSQGIFPTRSCIEVNNLPKNANIEIDAIVIDTSN